VPLRPAEGRRALPRPLAHGHAKGAAVQLRRLLHHQVGGAQRRFVLFLSATHAKRQHVLFRQHVPVFRCLEVANNAP
jgi:hypothetical protein